jgi:hypothetical protein
MADLYSTAIDDQTQWFEKNMERVAKKMRNSLNSLLNQFDRKGGNLEYTTANIQYASQSYFVLVEELQKAGYYDLVAKLQNKENDLLKALKSKRSPGAIPISFTLQTQNKLKALNSLYELQFASVAEDAMKQITGIVMDTIVRTGKVEVAIKQIAEVLDNKLVRYSVTYANTTRAKFIQAVEYASAEEYTGEKYWQYVGPTDDLNRPACIEGLDKEFFTDDEREEFEARTADERMYNCRHTFIQITKKFYDENKT